MTQVVDVRVCWSALFCCKGGGGGGRESANKGPDSKLLTECAVQSSLAYASYTSWEQGPS